MKTLFLKKQIIKIFQKYGLSKDHALISTNALINAELVGAYGHGLSRRSEERRVGKECRSRWSPYH